MFLSGKRINVITVTVPARPALQGYMCFGFAVFLSSLCLGGAHCELLLLSHAPASNHASVIHHHVPWPLLKAEALSSTSLDYWVWHVGSSFFMCFPIRYFRLPVNRFSGPALLPQTLEHWAWMLAVWSGVCVGFPEQSERVERVEQWFGVRVRRTCFPSLNLPIDLWLITTCIYSAPGVFVWMKNC